jgi:hypothetical protein
MLGSGEQPNKVDNHLMLNCYFINPVCSTNTWRRDFANRFMGGGRELGKSHAFFAGAARKSGSPRSALLYFRIND